MATLFDDRVGGPAIADKRMSLPPNWTMQEKQDGSASYYLNNVTGEMRSSYPYDSDVYYNYHSEDEDSATSTVDSHVSQSMEDLVTTQVIIFSQHVCVLIFKFLSHSGVKDNLKTDYHFCLQVNMPW